MHAIKRQENHSLSQLYFPKSIKMARALSQSLATPLLNKFMEELVKIRESFEDSGGAIQASALQEVEQEREVAVEAETVRAVKNPLHRLPLPHLDIHHNLRQYCVNGLLKHDSVAYRRAYNFLGRTKLGSEHKILDRTGASKLYVSEDFTRTVELPGSFRDDNYIRQVNWLIYSMVDGSAIIVSPWEAEQLLPMIRDHQNPRVHLLTYAPPVTRNMLKFDSLDFYAMPSLPSDWQCPRWLRRDVGMLAGKLYFRFEEYGDICNFLGINSGSVDAPESPVNPGALIRKEASKLTANPLVFLQKWLTLRRYGQDISYTPMGYIVQEKALDQTHPFFLND